MISRWKQAQSLPPLTNQAIHIWRADLKKSLSDLQSHLTLLSPEEKKRAEQFIAEEHRWRYIASHVILRQILSRYVNQPAAALRFHRNEYGKPYLYDVASHQLQFNMSDTPELALYAFTRTREVGVDIEWMRPDIDVLGIAKRFFSPLEQQTLMALPASEQLAGFYRCWTQKEAYIKVIGRGLSFPLREFSVSLQKEGIQSLVSVHESEQAAKEWSLGSISIINPGYAAAFATAGNIEEMHFFEWQPEF